MRVQRVALVVFCTLTAPAAHASSACHPAGSRVVAAGRETRVLQYKHAFWSCYRPTGALRRLWLPKDAKLRLAHVHFSGRFVGYAYYAGDPDCDGDAMGARTMSAASGRHVQRIRDDGCQDVYDYRITDLVVTTTGGLAVIRQFVDFEEDTKSASVIAGDAVGGRLLDGEAGIDVNSLTYAQGQVHWRRRGAPQSAALA
jgi:hypothetical protein